MLTRRQDVSEHDFFSKVTKANERELCKQKSESEWVL